MADARRAADARRVAGGCQMQCEPLEFRSPQNIPWPQMETLWFVREALGCYSQGRGRPSLTRLARAAGEAVRPGFAECPWRPPAPRPVSLSRLSLPNTCASFHVELSAEAKAALLEFEERERQHKQGRYGSRRGGRRGGALLCRGLGDQRRENSDRGRMKDHRPALLPTQPPVVVRFAVSLRSSSGLAEMRFRGCCALRSSLSLTVQFADRISGLRFFIASNRCYLRSGKSSPPPSGEWGLLDTAAREEGSREPCFLRGDPEEPCC